MTLLAFMLRIMSFWTPTFVRSSWRLKYEFSPWTIHQAISVYDHNRLFVEGDKLSNL